jgi:glycosyl hydrolase family 42 (putative beta-galactosidase)
MNLPAGLADAASIPVSSHRCVRSVIAIVTPLVLTILTMVTDPAFSDSGAISGRAIASLRIYNPTGWDGPVVLEVPIGRIASPGILDWDKIRLVRDGREIPFAIREGTPHWKAKLVAPIREPRAEDLLIISTVLPPATWVEIDVLPGQPIRQSALSGNEGRLIISYPDVSAVIDRPTGTLLELEAFGQSILERPLAIEFHQGVGDKQRPLEVARTSLVSSSSCAAMTELNFVLQVDDALAVGLTYRVHAAGLVEIWSDERPWKGRSPWLGHTAAYSLDLKGEKETLSYLVNRAPFYGFKDYEEVVKTPALIHRSPGATVVELGEEFSNGRRWNRRLYLTSPRQAARAEVLAELADEGPILDINPVKYLFVSRNSATVVYPEKAAVAAELLAGALGKAGLEVDTAPSTNSKFPQDSDIIALRLLEGPDAKAIQGDGFAILAAHDPAQAQIVARTPFGLVQGALQAAGHLRVDSTAASLPLVARNPAVQMRAGGFGGGNFEVDFPHESDAEWEHAFDGMIHSGMNIMADLSMWSNWRMTVSYKYMPEIRSDSPDALDEMTRTKFSEIEQHRRHGLKLLDYLHQRGVKVWQWIPIGAVPTTFAEKHPEAMCPTTGPSARHGFSGKHVIPCHTHALYRKFLEAYTKELLETYPIDGIVMVRDDNGGICDCPRCQEHLAQSRTKNAAWEQYLILYDMLQSFGFSGDVAVYPYFDHYKPHLDPLLPDDLLIVGHGSAAALLARRYDLIGPMGDTWIDNLFAGFRVAPSARMKRLLADRPSFWIGGAYCGTELAWESIAYFGWEPTATPNSFRYEWAVRTFGTEHALAYVALIAAYDGLREKYNLPMHPRNWIKLNAGERGDVSRLGRQELARFRERLADLEQAVAEASHAKWFAHLRLFGSYFEYHLGRLENFSLIRAIVAEHPSALNDGLPEDTRQELIALHREMYDSANAYDEQAAGVPGNMMAQVRNGRMTRPFKEWVAGYDAALEWQLDTKQFAGSMQVAPGQLSPGRPFTLQVVLQNAGVIPWLPDVGQRIELSGDVQRLDLPAGWDYQGDWMVFGDRRTVELKGKAPDEPGRAQIKLDFIAPFRGRHAFITEEVILEWK